MLRLVYSLKLTPHTLPKHLAPDETHVWQTTLTASSEVVSLLQQTLSPDEQARAAGFKFDRDRHRYRVAHGVMRHILANYVNCAPSEFQFETNAYGKPHLAGPSNATHLRFNLSHSHDVAVIAIAHDEVGIDIEQMRPLDDLLKIARQFFLADEAEALQRLPPEVQLPAFYRVWTRKEAYLKAIGTGLTTRLDGIHVRPSERMSVGIWEPLDERFHAQELDAPPPYVCALVAGVVVKRVCRFSFELK